MPPKMVVKFTILVPYTNEKITYTRVGFHQNVIEYTYELNSFSQSNEEKDLYNKDDLTR